jgi:hypothetical protein
MTWKDDAAEIIRKATSDIPDDALLSDRIKAINSACPSWWRQMSWPQKAWQAARRDYLVRYGYKPRTKKQKTRDQSAVSELPLFDRGMHE